MTIAIKLNQVMSEAGVLGKDFAIAIGITNVNLSRINTGKIRAIRFSTLDAMCEVAEKQPGDFLVHVPASKINDKKYLAAQGLDPQNLVLAIR